MWQIVAVTWSQDSDMGFDIGDYQLIKYQNLAAIVTHPEYKSLKHLATLDKVNALFSYQSVLERAGLNRTIIPVRFGTMVRTKKDVQLLLEKDSARFCTLLNYAKDKNEFDLMGIWKEKIGTFNVNIFEDLEKKGYEIKPHQPVNRAICFHFSILMTTKEQETFEIVKEDLDKKLGKQVDLRISEPLPPYNFFTVDLRDSLKNLRKHKQNTIKND